MGFLAPASTLHPLQILFLNMVPDVFPALALGLGRGDKTVMERPPGDPKNLIISNKGWVTIAIYAALMSLAVIVAVLYCKQTITIDAKVANNVAFLTLAFAQLFHVFNMSSAHSNLLVNDITKNKFIWLAIMLCTALLLLVYALPQMRLVLGLGVLSARIWMVAILAGTIPLILVQAYKATGKKERDQ